MPIEIRELVIKVQIEEKPKQPLLGGKGLKELTDKIVAECVEKVLKKIETKQDR